MDGVGQLAGCLKHPLGLWEGSTENKTVCSSLISNLTDRGLPEDRTLLFVIDGGKGIRSAIGTVWGELAVVQRCRQQKERNVTDHLPKASARPSRASCERRGTHPMSAPPSVSCARSPSA